ncbi:hypothetical protein D3C78_1464170 [compost metagenome]
MICSSCLVPSVATTSACVSPRVNSALPCARGSTPRRTLMGRTVRVSRPSIRGSPFRIWPRTMADSSENMMLSTVTASGSDSPFSAAAAASLADTSADTSRSLAVRACFSRIW